MPYKIAGIDVHKKMLAVVVSDVEIESEYQFERRMFSSNPEQLRSLAAWLVHQEGGAVGMEAEAHNWETVWEALERYWKPVREKQEGARQRSGTLHLAQALSNRGRRGRKKDFMDARCRATSMANNNTQEVPVEARLRADTQPIGGPSGRGAY